jgi:hypothetical protein
LINKPVLVIRQLLTTEEHSLIFYLLMIVLGVGVLQALSIGGLFFFKRSGEHRSNYFFGLLLITFGLTVFHYILLFLNVYDLYPKLYFLPVYFTLSFPTLLFYHIKLNLYPSYRLRSTDIKHFVLPVGQFAFFVTLFFSSVAYKSGIDRWFYNPFYGAFEQFLYLTTFYAYMYFSWRYVRQKQQDIRSPAEGKKVWYAQKLLQVLFVLFGIHTFFVLGDFIGYEFLHINLRTVKPWAALGILSFVAILFWLGVYGFQVLLWGRKLFTT